MGLRGYSIYYNKKCVWWAPRVPLIYGQRTSRSPLEAPLEGALTLCSLNEILVVGSALGTMASPTRGCSTSHELPHVEQALNLILKIMLIILVTLRHSVTYGRILSLLLPVLTAGWDWLWPFSLDSLHSTFLPYHPERTWSFLFIFHSHFILSTPYLITLHLHLPSLLPVWIFPHLMYCLLAFILSMCTSMCCYHFL